MSARPQKRVLIRAREEIVTSRALRRLIGVAVFAVATTLAVGLALLVSMRIRPRALELF